MPLPTAIIYTRVSTEDQAGGVSLDAQLTESRRYAAQKGWLLGAEYTDVMSGRRDDRPQYQAMLAHVRTERERGTTLVVVVAALDRLGRKLIERVRSREELKQLGVPVHGVRDGGEVSDLVANILAAVAEEESARTGQRVTTARAHIREGGWWTSGRIAWGYTTRDATEDERRRGAPRRVFDADETTAPFVREAYQRAAAGQSIRAVMRWIATLPAEARGGRSMSYYVTRLMLMAPVYIARSGMAVPAADADDVLARPVMQWSPLVTEATWLAVQRQIDSHKVAPKQASNRYLLSSFARCEHCGGRMVGAPGYGYRAAYRCNNNVQRGATAINRELNCNRSAIVEEVDRAVIAEVSALLDAVASADPRLRAELPRAWKRLQRGQPVKDDTYALRLRALETTIAKAEAKIKQAAVLYVEGHFDRAGYEHVRDTAQVELQAATGQRDALQGEQPRIVRDRRLPPLAEVLALADGWSGALRGSNVAGQRDILKRLVSRVTPHRTAPRRYEVTISWSPLGEQLRTLLAALQDSA